MGSRSAQRSEDDPVALIAAHARKRSARACGAWWPIRRAPPTPRCTSNRPPIAGKTGTAETGEDRASHAWFAGYAPADEPKLAFVVVLEHAGDAATAAGPVAKRLVLRMEQLGML